MTYIGLGDFSFWLFLVFLSPNRKNLLDYNRLFGYVLNHSRKDVPSLTRGQG